MWLSRFHGPKRSARVADESTLDAGGHVEQGRRPTGLWAVLASLAAPIGAVSCLACRSGGGADDEMNAADAGDYMWREGMRYALYV